MNIDTGKVYTDLAEIDRARARGERLTPISDKAAKLLGIGRAKRLQELRRHRRRAKAAGAGGRGAPKEA